MHQHSQCAIIPDFILHHLIATVRDRAIRKALERTLALSSHLKSSRGIFAHTLDVPRTPSGRNRLTYTMNKTSSPMPGDLVAVESGPYPAADDIAIDAHEIAGIVYDFYQSQCGLNSIDNQGLTLVSSVHYDNDPTDAGGMDNAFWDGKQMAYGDGTVFKPLVKDKNVGGHEITHGLTQFTCGLRYIGQSGALNESFSDVAGVVIKQKFLNQDVTQAAWLVGEDIVTDKFPGKALRSFKDEKAWTNDPQPKNMKNYVHTLQDNGGVHYNSGIPNHAFYLFANTIGGVAWALPFDIWYHAHIRLKSFANFKDFAKATMKEARTRNNDAAVNALKAAWGAVGIKVS